MRTTDHKSSYYIEKEEDLITTRASEVS